MTQTHESKVYLVGAGPGDPELLTVKAHALLRQTQLVLHDDLVPEAILALAGPQAEIVNVGKRCGAKGISQEEIHTRMIEATRAGISVVRLKSGDPGIFGRLAEEMDALEEAGVPFEVVPGITAAIAAAASLGVSLTDRRRSSRVVIVSGHQAHGKKPLAQTDWKGVARDDATLVIYMPGHDFTAVRKDLLAAGLSPDIPAVIVSHASTPAQQQRSTTLGELSKLPGLESPAVLLIGRTLDAVHRRLSAEAVAAVLEEAAILASP